jgi:hypothetical protein
MFHAINAWLARHRRQIHNITGLARDNAIATAHGWHAEQIKPGTWSYRDPRFIYRKFELTQPGSDCEFCDGKIAEWLYYGDHLEVQANSRPAKVRRWS